MNKFANVSILEEIAHNNNSLINNKLNKFFRSNILLSYYIMRMKKLV